MPTARELLEQADALMRRNRANTLDDIPVLMDAVPAAVLAPAPRTDVPPADAGPPSVPLLTENIEVIDEDATLGAEAVEGEPSAWLEFEDANPSVIGDAPDSIAIVPPVAMQAQPPDEALLASAEHEEIEFTLPAEEMPAAETIEVAAAGTADAEPPEADAEEAFVAEVADATEADTAAAIEADADADKAIHDAYAAAPVEAPSAVLPSAPEPPAMAPPPAASPFTVVPPASVVAAGLAAHAASAPAVAAAAPAAPVVAPAVPNMVDDDERWVAAAEEIRMQVLQRIDLFTDTGLRDQLTQRLQPIADRASADFVKAINLHVGDLLRTYVAEAIEREIERWRRDH